MKISFNYYFFYICIFFCLSSVYSDDSKFHPPKPIFPAYGAFPQTSKVATTVKGNGIIGGYFDDKNTNTQKFGFEFPANQNINYMSNSGLWVGGIVDNDTLVSTAFCEEIVLKNNNRFITFIQDFHPPLINNDTASTFLHHTDYGDIYHTTFADTFIPTYNFFSNFIDKHKSMGLQVTLKTFTKNIPPFKNIVLLDFIITNKNNKPINSTYVGMYLNSFAYGECNQVSYNDDLVGSFQDRGIVYVMDNDGELNLSDCQSNRATGAMALQTMKTYPPPTDTNFNWWTKNLIDYGPHKSGTIQNPYRDIGYGEFGTPYGDSNRYYIMSQPAWDFDQYLSRQITQNDTTWYKLDDTSMTQIAQGASSDFLLSLGPYNLQPDSSIRAIFALIGTDLVHIDKNNYQNLLDEKYDEYYDNLFFDVFNDNIHFTKILTDEYLNPQIAPIAFRQKALSPTSAFLTWDNYVFPEVIGYKIQVKEIPKDYLLTPQLVTPDIIFDELTTPPTTHLVTANKMTINNLQENKLYLAQIAHRTSTSETSDGNFSDPIIIGANNPFIKPDKVIASHKFAQLSPEFNLTTLKWDYADNSDIAYFKIYRAKDSASAHRRYTPFLYAHPEQIPFVYQNCFDVDDSTICFYEWKAFDSVESNIQQYTDKLTNIGFHYWITAVNNFGVESDFSNLIQTIPVTSTTKDIVAIIGSTDDFHDFVYADSITQYFNKLLQGYNYDLYQWTDTVLQNINCPEASCLNWEDLADYKLILINEYAAPKILTDNLESQSNMFSKLSDLGHNIAFFGIPSGKEKINLTFQSDTIQYNKNSFEQTYMGIEKTLLNPWFDFYEYFGAIDSLGGFMSAIPTTQSLPVLTITSSQTFYKPFIKQLFDFTTYTPLTPAFIPNENIKTLYTYNSAFPETSNLHGKPVGIMKNNNSSKFFSFGFHLWTIELQPARELIQFMLDKPSQAFPIYTIPENITLNQNFPNPFNGTTTISFSLPKNFTVSVDIYNILGQNIKSIIQNEKLSAGTHRYFWDGTNSQNNEIASGVYFYRLQIDEFSFTNKMILLK